MPPADFLLEGELLGTPLKAKAIAFWEHIQKIVGGSVGGVQPFLRKESSENDCKGIVDSADFGFCKITFFWLIEVGKIRRTLLLAKAKSSKSFYFGASHDFFN